MVLRNTRLYRFLYFYLFNSSSSCSTLGNSRGVCDSDFILHRSLSMQCEAHSNISPQSSQFLIPQQMSPTCTTSLYWGIKQKKGRGLRPSALKNSLYSTPWFSCYCAVLQLHFMWQLLHHIIYIYVVKRIHYWGYRVFDTLFLKIL